MDEHEVTRKLKLKDPFKQTDFYKYGVVWLNDRLPKNYQSVQSFDDLGVKMQNYVHTIATGHGGTQTVLANEHQGTVVKDENRRDAKVKDIGRKHCSICHCTQSFLYVRISETLFPQYSIYQRLH